MECFKKDTCGKYCCDKPPVSSDNTDNAQLFFYRRKFLTIVPKEDWNLECSKLSPQKKACIQLGIKKGFTEFHLNKSVTAENDKHPIGSYKKISNGTHGEVYILTYFNAAVKVFNEQAVMMNELGIYELINKVYPDPEEKGLPRILGHGDNYIIIPLYSRDMGHMESEKIYNDLAMSIYNLHSLGINHRDIKFHNVMIDNNRPILIDFGLASWWVVTSHRPAGTSIQTMWFRAPEVAVDRKRENPTLPASDWWSYGIMLASNKKMLLTPRDNDELLENLESIFDSEDMPKKVHNKARPFLHKDPSKRMNGATFLNLPPITKESLIEILPVADNIFKKDIIQLPLISYNLASYFAAVDYIFYLTESEAFSVATCILGGLYCDFVAAGKMFDKLKGNLLRMNTFSILALKYSLKEIALPCFTLTLQGTQFPHTKQAEWIENYFIKGVKGSHPDIEKVYFDLVPKVKLFKKAKMLKGYI